MLGNYGFGKFKAWDFEIKTWRTLK
jgi:hypothetical protein